ncbi:MAG: type II toxin-antitoxin system Phd/YefM family antitoxin [Chloroflexota bacterium]
MATSTEQFIVDAKGRRTAVILSVARYQQLLEDLHDLGVVAERREEPSLSLDELRARLEREPV